MAHSVAGGSATGALFMTGFGAVWALGATAATTSTTQTVVAIVGVVAVTIALLIPSLGLLRASRGIPDDDSVVGPYDEKRTGRLFNLVFAVQGVAIALTILICNLTGHTEFIAPVIAIVVGAHFLPLAALFDVRLYYATGALMILIPIVVMLAVPSTRDIGQESAWMTISMAGSAAVLWLTALGVLLMGNAALSGREFSLSRE